MAVRGKFRNSSLKRAIKFLAVNRDLPLTKHILQKASPDLVKSISNAALTAYKGKINLTPKERSNFSHQRLTFAKLSSPKISLPKKKRILVNQSGKGFGALIPILLSTVLGTVGSAFFNRSGSS